ncbi:MAG: hypothetical protein KF765_12340 [Parvibaculaceae bacterium]|nr:hypothetical protein [Parvibaculaceae bacterium]
MSENAALISMLLVRRSALQAELREMDALIARLRGTRARLTALGVPRREYETLEEIEGLVCRHFGLTPEELAERSRALMIARPRQLAIWLGATFTLLSTKQLGRHFDRDHTTVMHACRKVPKWTGPYALARDELRAQVERYKEARAA